MKSKFFLRLLLVNIYLFFYALNNFKPHSHAVNQQLNVCNMIKSLSMMQFFSV